MLTLVAMAFVVVALLALPLLILRLAIGLVFLPFKLLGVVLRIVFGVVGLVFRVVFSGIGLVFARSWRRCCSSSSCPCCRSRCSDWVSGSCCARAVHAAPCTSPERPQTLARASITLL